MNPIFAQLAEGGVSGIAKGLGGFARDIRAAVTGKEVITAEDTRKILELTQQMETAALNADVAVAQMQADINKVEAASGSIFRGGWRPAVGWVCVLSIGYQFLLRPILPWSLDVFGYVVKELPGLDMGSLMTLLAGMLGLGGMRTFEKVRGGK
jgi:hypothetical protein